MIPALEAMKPTHIARRWQELGPSCVLFENQHHQYFLIDGKDLRPVFYSDYAAQLALERMH